MSLIINALSAGYGSADIIRNINIDAQPGELVALIGPNGSGKSTLIKALAGLLPASSGEIWIGDRPAGLLEPRERARRIAYLAQDRQAPAYMRVSDVLELGRAPYRGRLGQISKAGKLAIKQAAEATDLTDFLERKFGELSGGEQARVLLARALVVDAPIVLADEPIAALDPYYQISILEILKTQARQGKTVIAALHDLRLAMRYADRVWVMHGGQLAANGPPSKIMNDEIMEKVFRIDLENGHPKRL